VRRSPFVLLVIAAGLLAAGCSSDEPTPAAPAPATTSQPASVPDSTSTSTTTAPTTTRPTSSAPTTTTSTTATTTEPATTTAPSTTTSTSTSTTSTTLPAAWVSSPAGTGLVPYRPLDLDDDLVEIGTSVEGRPIVAERYGSEGGRRVLVIGVIHGDEAAGRAIVEELRGEPVPGGVELWLVESMNPDGQAAVDRHNANHVDLNRNFPFEWGEIGAPGDGQYAGPYPASEPETQAIVNLIAQLRPDIVIWYHQDLFVISPSRGRDGRIRARYAELTAWPMGGITGGTYTGVAATWARNELRPDDSVAFIVELGPTLSPEQAVLHANAVRTIAAEG
jgi:protein MpaA